MVKVKAIISFNDLEANTHRNIGDIFECSKARCAYLLEHKAIEFVETIQPIIGHRENDVEYITPLNEKAMEELGKQIEKYAVEGGIKYDVDENAELKATLKKEQTKSTKKKKSSKK